MEQQPDRVADAFATVPRAGFLPRGSRRSARQDAPVPIGHGQTNSQPRTVEAMLRLLDVRPGHRVLDVGAGSGWTTALLGRLVGPAGLVVGTELEPALVAWGGANLARCTMPWSSIRAAVPGLLGAPDLAPFDRVLVSADARRLPGSLVEQLADDGRLVVPVAGSMVLVRLQGREPSVTHHGRYRFVPLRETGEEDAR